MKVLFLSNNPPEVPGRADAYNTRLAGLRQGLEAQGVQTELLSLRTMRFSRPNLVFALNGPAIARRAAGATVVHAASPGSAVAALAARQWHDHRVVFDVHGDEVHEALLEWRTSPSPRRAYLVVQALMLDRLASRLSDRLLVVSSPFRRRFEARGVPPERLLIARNGVDSRRFIPGPPTGNPRPRLCYAGGFQSWQAINVFIEALAQAVGPALQAHLVGFGPREQALKATIAARFGPDVLLDDWMPTDALIGRLQQADILIIPRTTHPAMRGGFPSKFAEYLALGKPLIVTNVDETAEFVLRHRCGLVCEPTAASLARAMRQAAGWDAEERAMMGGNARRLAERVLDWRVIGRDYLRGLEQLVAEKDYRYGADSARAHRSG